MPKVKINLPQYPDGTEISVKGLGLLVNNEETEVSDEAVEAYESLTGKSFSDLTKEKQFGGPGSTRESQLQLTLFPSNTVTTEEVNKDE